MRNTHKVRGSITVFLSMTLLIIISLVMTTVEALRVYNMSVYTNRALYTALDSVLADYYYPLFNKYHIFGLDGAYTGDSIQNKIIQDKISDYMEYTFNPYKDISFAGFNLVLNAFEMYGISTDKVRVENLHTLMDYDGELFRKQATQYTKYRLAGDGVESLLDKFNLINGSEIEDITTTQFILREKMTAEKEISVISEDILELTRLMDGIIITNKGPKVNRDGSLYINNTFIKKICNSQATINNPYPSNPWVSSSLKGKYVNPKQLVDKSINYLDLLIENNEIRKSAMSKKDVEECNKKEKELISDFRKSINEISNLVNSTNILIDSAISVVKRINKNQDEITDTINNFEASLKSVKADISNKLYSSFWNDYKELEKYKNNGANNKEYYDFIKMQDTLEENKSILNKVNKELNFTITSNEKTWLHGKEKLSKIKNSISGYSHDGLQLDYSFLAKREEEVDFFGSLEGLINDGIMDILLDDTKEISSKNISDVTNSTLPSIKYKELKKLSKSNKNGLGGMGLTKSFTVFIDMLDDSINNFSGKNLLSSTADAIGENFLYQKYLFDHFATFKTESKLEMPTALDYEIEYILGGKKSDSENIKSVTYNLLIIRTIMNTISLISNTNSSKQATLVATSLVGFLAMPILVSITKTIILFAWGLAEALIDISAILKEKSIAIYKEFKDFQIQVTELPYLSKSLIRQKVDRMESKKSPLCLNYEDHLNILLLLKNKQIKTFRALDLIQINLQNNYEDSFLINNCIFGIQVYANFSMDQKFLSLPFIKDLIKQSKTGYSYHTRMEYSY